MSNITKAKSILDSFGEFKTALESLPSRSRLSDGDAEAIYTLGYQSLVQGQLQGAFDYFALLSLYRPTEVKYLKGLARTCRLLEDYEQAIRLYSFLVMIDPSDMQHNLDIAECLLMLRSAEEARDLVRLVIQACKESSAPGNAKVGSRAQALGGLLGVKDESDS
ncbi:MAG: tetratricopeptide repeat protein [Ramlibacter sp.]